MTSDDSEGRSVVRCSIVAEVIDGITSSGPIQGY